MSNLSDLLPAGAGAKVITATASGNLSTGQTVILQSDGTVKAVEQTSVSATAGSATTYDSGDRNFANQNRAMAYDSTNDRVVIAYRDSDNSNYGTAVVGAVSGTSISFGSPVVYNSSNTISSAPVFDENAGKVVIFYRDQGNSERGTAIVGTVSGTSISFGSAVVFNSGGASNDNAPVYDPDTQKIVNVYKDEPNSRYGTAIVGTVSGTSISFGSEVVFETADSESFTSTYDTTANKVVIAYRDTGNSEHGTAIVGTVSGTSISFGSAVVFNASNTRNISAVYDPSADKTVLFFRDHGDSSKGKAVVGTVSGTSISFGSATVYQASQLFDEGNSAAYFTAGNKLVVAYRINGGDPEYQTASVSGSTITFDSAVTLGISNMRGESIVYDSTNEKMVVAAESGNSNGQAQVFSPAYVSTNSANFAGITNQAINDTASGEVVVEGGVITNGNLSLTVGATYYVQDDGSLQSDTVTVPYSLNSASYDNVSFDYSGQDGSGQQVLFKPDGTKMYILGSGNDSVFEYDLSSAFDLSTASYQRSKSVNSQDNFPVGLAFNSNGTKMFITGNTNDAVFQYSLSGAYDVSTASYDSVSFSVTSQDTHPYGLFFNNDGTKMFVVGDAGDDINEYALSSGFDISTASYTRNFSVASQETNPRHVSFNPDGTKMYVVGTQNDKIQVYSLATGFDLSTASFLRAFAVNTEDTQPNGITFNANGTKVFLIGESEDKVFQYTAGVGSITSVTAGKALAATTLLLKG